jgi:predicted house-cleaning noncanonical NTP pyrophosphatase (MazG superfamily)
MTVIYNKLVRDKIPTIIEADGKKATTRILEETEYLNELIKKLDEELAEFKIDVNVEELADLQEVLLALAVAIGASKEELERVRADKAAKRGAFNQKIFLEEVA